MSNPTFSALQLTSFFLIAAIACAGCVAILLRPASRWGLVDRPGGRKQHECETPVVGGIAMALAYLAAMMWFSPLRFGQAYLLIGMAMLVALGVLDDLRDLSAWKKLLLQVAAALVMVVPEWAHLHSLGNMFGLGAIHLDLLAVPFTVFALVGLINAVNMSDGIDGSAGGLVGASLAWLFVIAILGGRNLLALELVLLFGVTVGFLWFNMRSPLRSRAAVFMGDAGSMMLGAGLAWFAVHITQTPMPNGAPPPPIVILWILGLPVLDTVVLMVRRLRQGRSPFTAGRDHMHHIWTHASFSIGQTTAILVTVQAAIGGAAVLAWQAGTPEWVMTAGYLLLLLIHRSLANHAWQVSKWLRRHRPGH